MSVKHSRRQTRKVSASLPRLIKDKGWERKLDQHRVFIDWAHIVDEEIADHARPLKVVKDVLWLNVENSAWMQQIQYQKYFLLDKLNSYLNSSSFSDIRLVVDDQFEQVVEKEEPSLTFIPPSPERVEQFKAQVSMIEDEETRESLIRLWYLSQACRKRQK